MLSGKCTSEDRFRIKAAFPSYERVHTQQHFDGYEINEDELFVAPRRLVASLEGEGETFFGVPIFRVEHVLLAHVEVVGDELSAREMLLQVRLVDGAYQRTTKMEFVYL